MHIKPFIVCISSSLLLSTNEDALLNDLRVSLESKDDWVSTLNNNGILLQATPTKKIIGPSRRLPLFKKYQRLEEVIPHIALGSLPTPVHKLEKVGAQLGTPNLYIKRDDLTGLHKFYGGNKVRKLEFLLAQALVYNAQTIITLGYAGSNHAVATSFYAKKLGLNCICMLKPQPHSYAIQNNLLMHAYLGTQLKYYPHDNMRKLGTIATWWDVAQKTGTFPYVIPTGGSSALGTLGFVNAAFELKEQIDAQEMPEPDALYVPFGSMATAAGLIIGVKLAGLTSKIWCVATEPEEMPGDYSTGLTKLIDETQNLLHNSDASIPILPIDQNDFSILYDFCGSGYGVFTEEGTQLTELLREHANIQLDGTYTAKAFSGLAQHLKTQKKDAVVLYWHTYCNGDFKEELASVSYKSLGHCFHTYIETAVQPLDIKRSNQVHKRK